MVTNKFGVVALMLTCATPVLAQDLGKQPLEREVWITIGQDAVEPVRRSLQGQGLELPSLVHQKAGVGVMRVRESQLGTLSGAIHDKLNRCAGFIAHESEKEALEALESQESLAARQAAPSLVSYTLTNAATVNALLPSFQEANIRSTITSLSTTWTSRRYNTQSGKDAATWLKNRWTTLAQGRSDITVEFFNHAASVSPQPSVILTIKGTTTPNEVVVLGGHLDSINDSSTTAPGADDDASGVASLTEVIRVAVAKGYRPAKTVKFMAYAAEEVGLKGSKDIATQYKNNGTNVVGVLQLDMTNYRGSAYDIVLVSDYTNAAQNTFLTNLIKTYLPGVVSTTTRCGYGCSDHASWYNQGFAASIPFESLFNDHNPAIHTVNDTLARTAGSAQHSVKFAQLAAAYVAELAKGSTSSALDSDSAH